METSILYLYACLIYAVQDGLHEIESKDFTDSSVLILSYGGQTHQISPY